jgi:hypothetical protein
MAENALVPGIERFKKTDTALDTLYQAEVSRDEEINKAFEVDAVPGMERFNRDGGPRIEPQKSYAYQPPKRLVGTLIQPLEDPAGYADIGTQAWTSLSQNPVQRARIYASQLFPNLPEQQAMSRMTQHDKRWAYYDMNDELKYAEPSLMSGFGGGLATSGQYVASNAGELAEFLIPTGVAMKVGMKGMQALAKPLAAVVSIDAGRQLLSALWDPDGMQFEDFDKGELAMSAGTELVGWGLGKVAARYLQTRSRREIEEAVADPATREKWLELKDKAEKLRVRLSGPELADLRSLKRIQNTLFDLSGSDDVLDAFARNRNTQQIPGAFDRVVGDILGGGERSTEAGALSAIEGSQATTEAFRRARTAEATPVFKDAFRQHEETAQRVDTSGVINMLRQELRTAAGPQAKVIQEMIQSIRGADQTGVNASNLETLDGVRKQIWGMHTSNLDDKYLGPLTKRVYGDLRERMANPDFGGSSRYGQALERFRDLSPEVRASDLGAEGIVAKQAEKGLDAYKPERALNVLFTQGPDGIRSTRERFMDADQEGAWKAGLQSYLRNAFETASSKVEDITNPVTGFRNAVFKTTKQQDAMREALGGADSDAWLAFRDMMDVFEASARVRVGGSRTAFSGQTIEDIKKLGRTAKQEGAAFIVRMFMPLDIPGRAADAILRIGDEEARALMAKTLLDDNFIAAMRTLRGISQSGEKRIAGYAQAFSDALVGGVEAVLTPGGLQPLTDDDGNVIGAPRPDVQR